MCTYLVIFLEEPTHKCYQEAVIFLAHRRVENNKTSALSHGSLAISIKRSKSYIILYYSLEGPLMMYMFAVFRT